MSEDFKPGETAICLGLPDSFVGADPALATTHHCTQPSKEFNDSFKEGTDVRILKKLVSGNYFVERVHPPLFRVRLSPENLKRREGETRHFNLAGVEMEGGFKRSDVMFTATHHKKEFKSEVFIRETDPIWNGLPD